MQSNGIFKLGLENISEQFKRTLKQQQTKIGIITNQTGIDQQGRRNIDVLREDGINLKAIFVPEHGLTGSGKNGAPISNARDQKTGIPIISLYKGESSKNTCSKKDMEKIDILIFDMQDSGMRHYTYISTLFKVLELAAKYNKKIIVLDRPNPLGGIMEGPLVEPTHISFISIAPIPIRHGMTIGELALYFNRHILTQSANLTIVSMQGYQRNRGLPKLDVMLSSGLRTQQACYAYSFLGLLGEIKPFFIGLKTDKPFEVLMIADKYKIPAQSWQQLKRIMQKFNIDGQLTQVRNTEKDKVYTGLTIKIKNINQVSAFQLFLEIVDFFLKHKIALKFAPTFNLAVGTDQVKKYFDKHVSKKELGQYINKNLKSFYDKAQSCFLYLPTPHIVQLS